MRRKWMAGTSMTVSGLFARCVYRQVAPDGVTPEEFERATGISEGEFRLETRIGRKRHFRTLAVMARHPFPEDALRPVDLAGAGPVSTPAPPPLLAVLCNSPSVRDALQRLAATLPLLTDFNRVVMLEGA